MTAYDELQLDTLGDKKTALFLIMSDTDATFNFLISMIYTQLFNLLCEKADDVYDNIPLMFANYSYLQKKEMEPEIDRYEVVYHGSYNIFAGSPTASSRVAIQLVA